MTDRIHQSRRQGNTVRPGSANRSRGQRRPRPLPPSVLITRVKPSSLGFRTTAELVESDEIVGQDRAVEAIALAMGMEAPGYNVFALGPPGIGKMTALQQMLRRRATDEPVPDDWCYVNDFDDPQRPDALRLPPGRGVELREAMAQFILDLQVAIVALFEAESYRARREALEAEIEKRRDKAIEELGQRATESRISVTQTPIGLAVAPMRDGKVLDPEEFGALSDEEKQQYRQDMERFGEELQELLREVPHWLRDLRRQVNALDREVTSVTVRRLVDEVRARFPDLPAVGSYLDDVERDVVSRAQELRAAAAAQGAQDARVTPAERSGQGVAPADRAGASVAGDTSETPAQVPRRRSMSSAAPRDPDEGPGVTSALSATVDPFRRYRVNVLVDNSKAQGAPFVIEDHPTQPNLVGRVEHVAQMGTLVTDFTLIRAGALHRANGGYLVLEVAKVLSQPYAWEQLKRSLTSRLISIESVGQSLGLLSTTTLEPQPIPLDVKVALTGDRRLYYLLCALDPEFLEHFKVQADFEDSVDRTPESARAYARLIGSLARREGLAAFEAAGVARVVEELSRMAQDGLKLSGHVGGLADLLRESSYLARASGRETVTAGDVAAAVAARRHRAARIYERIQESIGRGIVAIRLEGLEVGQVNALSVIQLGDMSFGHPSRVTASVRLGRGVVVDIEREVELGGPIHSKGVLILAGFLGHRFGAAGAPGAPLSLHASLVFEQSYGGVEGDSASLAELCALLSAIGEVPLRQDIAVTGSVDQHGRVQAVGGVNEKIEGFFDACLARADSVQGGVIVPDANVAHLMLADRVVAAALEQRFSIWPVSHVDQALALLSQLRIGSRGRSGRYPPDSVNGRVEASLEAMAIAGQRAREAASAG